jgi:hypothetical protein
MKILFAIFLQIFVGFTQSHVVSKTTIDWNSIKQLQEIPSYVKNFGKSKIVDLSPSIAGGELAGPTDIPYQVNVKKYNIQKTYKYIILCSGWSYLTFQRRQRMVWWCSDFG